jgi:hypothetical protein
MRMFIVVAIAVAVGAIGGFMIRPVMVPDSAANHESIIKPIAVSATLWPHEIHLNHPTIKELPVHDIKEPF